MTMICPICGRDTQHDADAQVVKCRHCLRSFQLEHMNTESQQQIAREAAEEAGSHGDRKPIIVYEQAAQPQRSKNTLEAHTKRVLDPDGPVSQRSEQQEWTQHGTRIHIGDTRSLECGHEYVAKALIEAHIAALTAERKKLELHKGTIDDLAQQLTTERQRLNQLTKDYHVKHLNYEKLEQQLLSALAAIGKLHDGLSKFWKHQLTLESLGSLLGIETDLSLLHEHDMDIETRAYAKGAQDQHGEDELARKPLVDALHGIALLCDHITIRHPEIFAKDILKICKDALANVKP